MREEEGRVFAALSLREPCFKSEVIPLAVTLTAGTFCFSHLCPFLS